MQPQRSFTLTSNAGLLAAIVGPCKICPAFDPRGQDSANHPALEDFVALWDTGATHSVITADVVAKCNLRPTGMTQTHGVHGSQLAQTYLVNFMLPNGVGFANVKVTLGKMPTGAQALIGMDIITRGDLAITNKDGRTVFTFRCPSIKCIDFVQDSNKSAKRLVTSVGGFSGGKHHKSKRRGNHR